MLLWFSERATKAKITILLEEEKRGIGEEGEVPSETSTSSTAALSPRFRDYQLFIVAE